MEENKSEYEATSNSYRKAPKIAQKMLLTKAVEKSRTKLQEITSMQENGDYTTAPDTGSTVTDTTYSMVKETTDFTVQQVRKFTRKQIQKYRERRTTERAETTCAHTASECGVSPKQAGHGTFARCRATSALWGRFAPTAGKRKSRHRQDRAARYSRCDPTSAPTAYCRK